MAGVVVVDIADVDGVGGNRRRRWDGSRRQWIS